MAAANNSTITRAAAHNTTKNWVDVLMGIAGDSALRAKTPAFEPKKLNPAAAMFIPKDQAALKELMTLLQSPGADPKPLTPPGKDLYRRPDGRTVVYASSLDNCSARMDASSGQWEVPESKPFVLSPEAREVFKKFGHKDITLDAFCSSPTSEDYEGMVPYLGNW